MNASISIDAMGGDRAPREVVLGAVRAVRELPDVELLLVGIPDRIQPELDATGWTGDRIRIVEATEVIEMGDSPAKAIRQKKGSSIHVGIDLVRTKAAQAFVSAGNTGACVAAAQLFLRTLAGVKRPGILVTTQVGDKPICLVDVGANVAPKPEHLLQYGQMASLYATEVVGVEGPRVGLLNIGEEDEKGTELIKATRTLLDDSTLDYVGYVEGDELYHDRCDIVVSDGFTGNVLLKVSEGIAERLTHLSMSVLSKVLGQTETGADNAAAGLDVQSIVRQLAGGLKQRLDYSEYGGAPLLGVDGIVIISHGRSDSNAFFNAIRAARRMIETGINDQIAEQVVT